MQVNKYRIIKVLYSSIVVIFIYILWGIMANVLGKVQIRYIDLFIVIFIAIIMQWLEMRNIKASGIIISLLIINFSIFYLFYGKASFIPRGFLGFISIVLLPKVNTEGVNYDFYRNKIKAMITMLFITIVFYIGIEREYAQYLFRYYLIFLLLAIWILREARKFNYKVNDKYNVIYNAATFAFVLILSTDIVFSFIKRIFGVLANVANKILNAFIWLLFTILDKPIRALTNFVLNLLLKFQKSELEMPKENNLSEELPIVNPENMNTMVNVFKVIILILLAYIVYRVIKGYRYKKSLKEGIIEETREKIDRIEYKSKKNLIKSIKDIFIPKTNREQVINTYRHLLMKAHNKEIFKKYMTGNQLKNLLIAKMGVKEPAKNITDIYNEAKFSSHEIKDEAVSLSKNSYSEIKKRL